MIAAPAILLLALATTAPTAASAPTTQPVAAAAPTTAPAVARSTTGPTIDQSSPKALLRSLFASHGEVDQNALRSLLHAANPVEQKILDSVVQIELANSRLRAAEKEKFGKATTAPSSVGPMPRQAIAEIDTFVEKIDGDKATVCPPKDPSLAIALIRIDGKWKLPIASLLGKIDPTAAETLDASTHAQVAIIDAVTAQVKAGKLTTEEQVKQELVKRLAERLAAATRSAIPQPATAPVSQPARGT